MGGVCGVKTCKGSNTESDCVTWCVKSSWLRQRKRRLRLELRVAPQIAQVTSNDLIPACLGEKEEEVWRRWGGGRGRGWSETEVRDSEGGDGQRGQWGSCTISRALLTPAWLKDQGRFLTPLRLISSSQLRGLCCCFMLVLDLQSLGPQRQNSFSNALYHYFIPVTGANLAS